MVPIIADEKVVIVYEDKRTFYLLYIWGAGKHPKRSNQMEVEGPGLCETSE